MVIKITAVLKKKKQAFRGKLFKVFFQLSEQFKEMAIIS